MRAPSAGGARFFTSGGIYGLLVSRRIFGGVVAHILRLMVWAVCMLLGGHATAIPDCTSVTSDQNAFSDGCEQMREYCRVSPDWECSNGTCQSAGQVLPACLRTDDGGVSYNSGGFNGLCPANGTEGPNIERTGTGRAGEAPPLHCSGPCKIRTQGCQEVASGGRHVQLCSTEHTGERCVPSPIVPESEDPTECNTGLEIGGECVTFNDGDEDPETSPAQPQICIGEICRDLPPTPGAGSGCSSGAGGAVCTSAPGGGNPPRPPNPPFPESQAPSSSGISRPPNGAPPTNISLYGPPAAVAPPQDGNGNCQGGSTPGPGGSCQCAATPTSFWNGAACQDGEPTDCPADQPDCEGEEDGDEREAGKGTCGGQAPHCSGDPIDCSVVYQTWVTRCALEESSPENRPRVDLLSDPLAPYGGAEEFFESVGGDEGEGPSGLDYGAFLGFGTGVCPTAPELPTFKGEQLVMPQVWCDLWWFRYVVIGLALIIAFRVQFGD